MDAPPSMRAALFKPLREGYSELTVDKSDIHTQVAGSSEYQAFAEGTADEVRRNPDVIAAYLGASA